MAFDGGFCGNEAFEFADNNLKSIGGIDVYDGRHGRGGWQGHSSMELATAEYKSNTYYVTMRGVGSLYGYTGDKDKKIAPPRSPITFFLQWSGLATCSHKTDKTQMILRDTHPTSHSTLASLFLTSAKGRMPNARINRRAIKEASSFRSG